MMFATYSKISAMHRRLIFLLCLTVVLGACNASAKDTPSLTPLASPLTATDSLIPTPEPVVSATATPSPTIAPSWVVLLAAAEAEADAAQVEALQTLLDELATAAGLRFERRSALAIADLASDLRIVVALPPDPGLANLASSAPQTQFLGIGIPDLSPATNLSVIVAPRADERGFLAGYIAAALTPEWRVGVIGVSNTAEGVAARQGFIHGTIFFCGLCKQLYPPFYSYPLYVEMPAPSSEAEWQAAADVLIGKAVKTIYVPSGAGDEALLSYLAAAGINLIGEGAPPESAGEHWIASLQPEFLQSVRQIWPDLLEGKGGGDLPMSLAVSNLNAELFSPGRQRLTMEMIQDLSNGVIDTGVKP